MRKTLFTQGELAREWDQAAKRLTGYHIHIYFDEAAGPAAAQDIADRVKKLFPGDTDGPHTIGKVGPHTKPNVELDITKPESFGKIVAWLQLNNKDGLSILIHPRTGDELDDHFSGATLWLGQPVAFNNTFFERLRQMQKRKLG